MNSKTRKAFLGYGLETELIDVIANNGHTVAELKTLNKKHLVEFYTDVQIRHIKKHILRSPILDSIIEELESKSNGSCCYCKDGNNSRPFQIHHIIPFSETQDNSAGNLMVVCPNHHTAIHSNEISHSDQFATRDSWYATIELSKDFLAKGVPFPFGAFQSLNYKSKARPAELVDFGPISPSTSLICYSKDLVTIAKPILEKKSFILVQGVSGSGKTTYGMALAGLLEIDGFSPFQFQHDKTTARSVKEVLLFIATSTVKSVLILDDLNTWASSSDLILLAKALSDQNHLKIIAIWTTENSDDDSKLQSSNIAKQTITWTDLRQSVIDAIIRFEPEVISVLKKFEDPRTAHWPGAGIGDNPIKQRILAIGNRPKTVYEFIFDLRSDDSGVEQEFKQLVQDNRADIPIIYLAIEQIAGFENACSMEQIVEACRLADHLQLELPLTSPAWVQKVIAKQIRNKRVLEIRQLYTTIHRKWAAKLLGSALKSPTTRESVQFMLQPNLNVRNESPERILRLWSWLRNLEESQPFFRSWIKSLTPADWEIFVERSARNGLRDLGFLASRMHLLFDNPTWNATVKTAFRKSFEQIMHLVANAKSSDWYWLNSLFVTIKHVDPKAVQIIIEHWSQQTVVDLILTTELTDFEYASRVIFPTREISPGWFIKLFDLLPWERFSSRLSSVNVGDLESLLSAFSFYVASKKILKRSMLSELSKAINRTFIGATLDDLRIDPLNSHLMILCKWFPNEALSAFSSLNPGSVYPTSQPRSIQSDEG